MSELDTSKKYVLKKDNRPVIILGAVGGNHYKALVAYTKQEMESTRMNNQVYGKSFNGEKVMKKGNQFFPRSMGHIQIVKRANLTVIKGNH